MRQATIAAGAASIFALITTTPGLAQDDGEVELLSNWGFDPIYAEGWSVENMFDVTEIIDATGDEIGDVENVIFSNEGEVLGIIAQVGGFWDIGDTHVHVPWSEVDVSTGIRQLQVPITEENLDEYDVFGAGWFDEQVITESDVQETQPVDDDLAAGSGIFKATDLVGDYVYLSDGARYGYVADIIVQDGSIAAIVTDAAAYGRPGYYAFPYAYRGTAPGPRYNMPYGPAEVDTIESFDYEQLQSRVTE